MLRFNIRVGSFMRQAAGLWPLLLPLLLILPFLSAFPYPSEQAAYSDMSLAHYPYGLYLRQAVLEEHRLPIWSPLNLSGAPFAANPLSGFWYLPGWLAMPFPLPFGFNLMIAVHLLWGGLGMYALMREEELSHRAALLAGLAFMAMPKLFAHYGAGHLTLLYAVPWTPWLLWSHARGSLQVFGRRFIWGEALIWGLIFVADARWGAYSGVLWWFYALWQRFDQESGKFWQGFSRGLLDLLRQTGLALLLVAPLALPLVEYTGLSTRSRMGVEDVLTFSLPPARLLGLLFPDFGGFHEWILYAGIAILMLSVLLIFGFKHRSCERFWLLVLIFSLFFALGSFLPFSSMWASLPLINLLRVPSRALFISGISLAALGAHATERLLEGLTTSERRRAGLPLVALITFVLLLAGGVWILNGRLPMNFAWGAGLAILTGIWIALRVVRRAPTNLWYLGLVGLCLLDWSVVDLSLFSPRPAEQVLNEGFEAAKYLVSNPGWFRIYSPSYSLPQQTAANMGLQLSDGVDPMQLQSYVTFMETATGVPQSGYSVTLPPYADGNPAVDNALYRPDPELLGLLNVRYVLSEYDLLVDGLELRAEFGRTRLYENQDALPRVWIQQSDAPPGQLTQPLEALSWTPQCMEILAQGPGLLVLSEIAYPGWRAWVNGQPVPLELVAGILRGVRLETGEQYVRLAYRPASLYLGLALWALGLMVIVVQFAIGKRDTENGLGASGK